MRTQVDTTQFFLKTNNKRKKVKTLCIEDSWLQNDNQ
jgi:hypothetical protein